MNLCAEDRSTHAGLELEAPGDEPRSLEAAIVRMESAVAAGCDTRVEWPARIAAGINAAIEFMVADPAAARTLAIGSRSLESRGSSGYPEMIGRFADLLGAGAPRSERLPASSDESVVWVIAAIVGCHVRAGTVEALAEGDPDLVFLALLPYVGFSEAARWSTEV